MKAQSNFKTPIEDIFFRSSRLGFIANGLMRHGLTENQRAEMEKLEAQKVKPEGLTEKQMIELDKFNIILNEGGNLTPAQVEKRDKYNHKLKNPKPLTENQEARLKSLKELNARPPELSQGAKTEVKRLWLENEKGFKEEVTDKKLRKGIQAENDAISLISYVDGKFYVKNRERVSRDHITGECDVIETTTVKGEDGNTYEVKIIHDTKCSWNPRTFMAASLTADYEWQGRAYMFLYNADAFRLRHCLVDCPPDVLADEYKNYCYQHNIIDDSLPKYQELIDQFYRNFQYANSGLYTREERVKSYHIIRDLGIESVMLTAVKLAVEYYQTITLNMIEE